jgi:hypothetical protein
MWLTHQVFRIERGEYMQKEIPTTYSPPGMLDWPCGVERLPNGNTLITDAGYWSGLGSELLEVDSVGRIVWECSPGLIFAHSAKVLGNGNILVSDTGKDRVLELDRKGNVVWSSEEWSGGTGRLSDGSHLWYPNDAEETSEGKILISDRNNNRMVEVDTDGEIVWLYDKLKHCHDADRLSNGNTMVASSDENKVLEIDPDGKTVWSYGDGSPEMLNWPRDADRLENGNTLIADSKNGRIIEVDKNGQIVWSFNLGYFGMPYEADRLSNDNTLISIQQRRQVIEVDPSGSIVWGFRNYVQGHIQEHLKNGNFELEAYPGAGYPAHWAKCPLLCEGEPPNLFWDSKLHFSENHSIGLEYYGTGSVWWQQTIRVTPGKLYRLTDTVKTVGVDGFAQTQVAFLDRMGGFFTPAELLPHTKPRKGDSDWNSDTIELRVLEEATAADIRCIVIGKGKAWFDSVSFEELPWG